MQDRERNKNIAFYPYNAKSRNRNDYYIGQNVIVAPGVKIGKNVKIQNNVSVYSGVILEDNVSCGPSVVFANAANTRSHTHKKYEFKCTRVIKGATVDANATIVCKSTIGRYVFIEASTLVTKDVPSHAIILNEY
jgi:UDP-2-acetamido-3-amino-2,3-dideoxy-glucuronate N-acetyltransferase